jgi:uncharacterized protein DUF2846
MLRSKFAFLVIFLVSLFAAAQQPAPTTSEAAPKSKATVYIYRYKQFVGSALSPSVYCDEAQLARMDNGRYFKASVDPGKHTFRSNDQQSGIDLDVKAGQDYFIRVEIAAGFMKGHGRLILTSAEQGRYEVQSSKLKPLDASKVVDSARVSVEEAKFETPVPAAAPQAQPQAQPTLVQGQNTNHGPSVVSISAGGEEAGSAGDSMSVAEASRRAKQKKATQEGTATTPQ